MLADEFFLGTKLYQQKLIEFCRPISEYLGITHAIYVNIDKHGKIFMICTHEKWVERFIEEKYYKLDSIMVHPNNMHNGFSTDQSSPDQDFQDLLLYDAVTKFNWCNSFAYMEKTTDGGYFGFDFGTTKDNSSIIGRVLNETQIIKKFIRHLHKNLKLCIAKDLEENRMDFAALKGDLFHSQIGLVFHEPYVQQMKIKALKELGFLGKNDDKYFLSNATLSSQEISCLRIYRTTPSIKQVARELNLAITTTTDYIENIKGKLNCINKNELLAKAEILESLGRI